MGNRAVITTCQDEDVKRSDDIGIYLHWNSNLDYVKAYLKYCEIKGYRPPEKDPYGWARLCQVIANFFGGELGIGIGRCRNLDCDNKDNGTYIIKDWKVVGRKYYRYYGNENSEDTKKSSGLSLLELLGYIDASMPLKDRLGSWYLKAKTSRFLEDF